MKKIVNKYRKFNLKKFFLLTLVSFFSYALYSQNPVGFYGYGGNYSWANHLSMNNAGTMFAMAGTVSGPTQHFLVTDNNGNVLMSKSLGKSGELFSSDIDNNGDIFAVGGYGSFGAYTKNLIRVTSAGALQFSKQYGSGDFRYVLIDGNYLLITGFDAKWNGGFTAMIGKPCILKANKSDGSIVWYKEYTIGGQDFVDSYVIRKLGTKYYITGSYNDGSGGGGQSSKSYILCVNESDGSVVWCKTYANPAAPTSPNFTGMAIDNSNLIVCGVSNKAGATGNLYVMNVNPADGTIIWQRTLLQAAGWHFNSVSGGTWGISCVMDPYGDVVVAYEDYSGATPSRGGLLAKLNISNGSTEWVKKYRTSAGDGFHGLVISACNYVASGWFHSTNYNYGLVISDSAGVVGGAYPTTITKTNNATTYTVTNVTGTTTVANLATAANVATTLSNVAMTKSTKTSTTSPTCSLPLPVKLLSFTGKAVDYGNELSWTTTTEINNDYFSVESSTDGINFDNIGTVKGNGNQNQNIDYQFVDRESQTPITYYRFKQVDFDGQYTYSHVISIDRKSDKLNIFPNPFTSDVKVEITTKEAGLYTFSFVDLSGKSIEEVIYLDKGFNQKEIGTTKQLSQGFYILKVINPFKETINITKLLKK